MEAQGFEWRHRGLNGGTVVQMEAQGFKWKHRGLNGGTVV